MIICSKIQLIMGGPLYSLSPSWPLFKINKNLFKEDKKKKKKACTVHRRIASIRQFLSFFVGFFLEEYIWYLDC